jgi:hypothetical protein
MMGDPHRLRTGAVGLEALLLRSSRDLEPPATAEEEVWRRLQIVTAAGAAVGATGLAASTAAAGSKVVAKTLWLSVLKWAALVAVTVPAAGVATRWAVHHGAVSAATVAAAGARPPAVAEAAPDSTSLQVVAPAPIEGRVPSRVRSAYGVAPTIKDEPSALKRESRSLGAARAKFATGDARGALDEVGRLGVEFPHGALVQEREVLAIDCLAALGDVEGVRARARAFAGRFPASPYRDHVRQMDKLDER